MENAKTNNSIQKNRGSALILVVVVTVLLSVIGLMFLMVSRVGDVMGTAAEQEQEVDQAVRMVTGRIEQILTEDLFGPNLGAPAIADGSASSNEPWDAPGTDDPWLASLEPEWIGDNDTPNDPTDDLYQWKHITNITGLDDTIFQNIVSPNWDQILRDGTADWTPPEHGGIIPDYQDANPFQDGSQLWTGCPADADGDGVADSVWVRIDRAADLDNNGAPDGPWLNPQPTDKPVYAAVRIIDNCGMLNLNTANMTRLSSPWIGQNRYLSEVDYQAFLRGDDITNPIVIKEARRLNHREMYNTFEQYHEDVIMNIENPNAGLNPAKYTLFDIGDELEIRNRFCLTSRAVARFEQQTDVSDPANMRFGCYETFDFGRGEFTGGWNVPLRVKRIPIETSENLGIWKLRMNPENFDNSSPWQASHNYGYYYDRRHVCTFTSFDRNLRWGGDPFLDTLPTEPMKEIYKKVFMPAEGHAVSVRADIVSDTPEARRNILHLLCAFRAYYMDKGHAIPSAARKASQIVANMIDYLDDEETDPETPGPFHGDWTDPATSVVYPGQSSKDPTWIDRSVITRLILQVTTDLNDEDDSIPVMNVTGLAFRPFDFGLDADDAVIGFERQPFISEFYTRVNDSGNVERTAIELINPYDAAISLDYWRIVYKKENNNPVTFMIQPVAGNQAATEIPAAAGGTPGRFVIRSHVDIPAVGKVMEGIGTSITDANNVELQRPDPRDPNPTSPTRFVTVDRIQRSRTEFAKMLLDAPDGQPTHHVLRRQDSAWKFTNAQAMSHAEAVPPASNPATLGQANGVTAPESGWQMPVANLSPKFPNDRRFFTLGDFQKVLFIGNQAGDDPNSTVTSAVANAAEEGRIRFDIVRDPELLGYICFLNRPEGSLPGRININTAATNVMAAAIPGNLTDIDPSTPAAPLTTSDPRAVHWRALDYAGLIPAKRPFKNLGDLVDKIPQFQTYTGTGSADVGETGMVDDLEERDWIISRMSTVFTTRSDVFTAYILVRVGQNGPQRRVMAIFDRSGVWTPEDRPEILALKTVQNPR